MIPTLIRLHGSLMVIAWMFLCTNGIILSRHYKHVWKKRGLKGLDAWLIAHQVFNSMTLICSAVATFVIVYFVQGYSYLNPSPFGAHPICGFTSIGLVLLNPVIALCRCPLTSSRRAIFNVVHKFLGLLAVALAIPTITLGLIMLRNMTVTTSPYSILTVFQAFVILYIITELALESIDYWVLVQERKQRRSEHVVGINMMTMNCNNINWAENTKRFIYYGYFLFSLSLTFIIVAQITTL